MGERVAWFPVLVAALFVGCSTRHMDGGEDGASDGARDGVQLGGQDPGPSAASVTGDSPVSTETAGGRAAGHTGADDRTPDAPSGEGLASGDGRADQDAGLTDRDADSDADQDAEPDAGSPAAPRWTSACHGLDRLGCEATSACAWATGAIDAEIDAGCHERCPVADGECGADASCEIVLSEADTCGELVCLPHDALPRACSKTFACAGEAVELCWLQRPHRCGPCDNCIDEPDPPLCLLDPQGTRHWFTPPEFSPWALPPNWSQCPTRPPARGCE